VGDTRKTIYRQQRPYRDLITMCEALVAKHTTAEIVQCGYFRGHPVVCLAGEDCERYADDLTPTVDEAGISVERPCVQCRLLAAPDGPDPCLGMVPEVKAACCGHGVEEPYVLAVHGTVRGSQALDYFSQYGVGPREDDRTCVSPYQTPCSDN
jgi:hypothetical protein